MDKQALVDQLIEQLRASARVALMAGEAAAQEAREGATPSERRESARVALENSQMAKAQTQRARRAQGEVDVLDNFRPARFSSKAPVALGAIVEVEDEDTGEGRTFFLAPAGAGMSLTGPGGDGLLSVVTPASPIGKAVLGRRVGDVIDVTIKGDVREWVISYVG